MSLSRREFFKLAGVVGGSTLCAPTLHATSSTKRHPPTNDDSKAVLVDIPKCIGCRRCEYACQDAASDIAPAGPIEAYEDKSVFTQHRRPAPDSYTTINSFKDVNRASQPVYTKANCLHCNDPACVSACLVGALNKRRDGSVVYDAWKCMGCRYCMVACPFQIPTYDYDTALTPQVRKCNLCAHKIPDTDDLPSADRNWRVPSCVKICPVEALTYGRRDDLLTMAREKITQQPDVYIDHIYGEHEAGGTAWLYIAGQPFETLGFLPLPADAPPRLTEAIQHGVFKNFVPPLAWFSVLGMIMWMTRQEQVSAEQKTDDHQGADR